MYTLPCGSKWSKHESNITRFLLATWRIDWKKNRPNVVIMVGRLSPLSCWEMMNIQLSQEQEERKKKKSFT